MADTLRACGSVNGSWGMNKQYTAIDCIPHKDFLKNRQAKYTNRTGKCKIRRAIYVVIPLCEYVTILSRDNIPCDDIKSLHNVVNGQGKHLLSKVHLHYSTHSSSLRTSRHARALPRAPYCVHAHLCMHWVAVLVSWSRASLHVGMFM